MLTFKEFMTESFSGNQRQGTGTGRTMGLGRGMLHNRQAASRMYSPKPPIGVDFDSWVQHRITNIANVLEFLYHRYETGDMVIVGGKECIAASEIEHWHEAVVKYLIGRGILVQMPAQNVPCRWIDRELSDSVPSFEHHAAQPNGKSKSMFFTTEETFDRMQQTMAAEIQEWINTQRMARAATPLPGVVFFTINPTQIVLAMQKQQDVAGLMNFGSRVWAGMNAQGHDERLRKL